ncbi:hypothetical protein GT937_23775 [Vibrio parahaemolyticus]|uniref:hypothetical protein n=1 Tax=Vibrio parahaemolyticus TaxID=670 RepID=UPI0029DFA7FF|nr:hypothetical protein [Vibrio parahaemolyticus]EJG0023294.1 hypothetical protein [Vibrio parahaemolyticus]
MRFFEDPNFVIMDFSCPYCNQDTTATVHEDGASCCNSCNSEVKPPMTYAEAKKLN